MKNLIIKILAGKFKKDYENELIDLYDQNNKRVKEYKKSFSNSKYIIIALVDNKLVGATRVISDMFMCALIIDLFVDEKYRGQGIGNEIMKNTINICKKKNIKNIDLITDNRNAWLPDFYKKLGFTNNIENGTYMSLN